MSNVNPAKIEYCSGFLSAMQWLNSELTDVYASFELVALPMASDTSSALDIHFGGYGKKQTELAKDFSAKHWSIEVSSLGIQSEKELHTVCSRWFFISSSMAAAPTDYHYRNNVVATFIDSLKAAIGAFEVFRVAITPQSRHANEWDDLVLEADEARYLLHFSRSD